MIFYVCAAHSLAVQFPFLAASVIVPISLAVQMIPLSINGFWVREAVFVFFFAGLGLDVSSALTLSLGSAALIMLFSLSGGAVFMLRPRGASCTVGPASAGTMPRLNNTAHFRQKLLALPTQPRYHRFRSCTRNPLCTGRRLHQSPRAADNIRVKAYPPWILVCLLGRSGPI